MLERVEGVAAVQRFCEGTWQGGQQQGTDEHDEDEGKDEDGDDDAGSSRECHSEVRFG